jgi:hypothetical protein
VHVTLLLVVKAICGLLYFRVLDHYILVIYSWQQTIMIILMISFDHDCTQSKGLSVDTTCIEQPA